MNKKTIWSSEYFCGNKISEYGLKNGYVDYATLAKSFDAVLCNDITKLFYSTIDREYAEAEQINGYIDNSEAIEELEEELEELQNYIAIHPEADDLECVEAKIEELEEQIEELKEQEQQKEIYQYYIISPNGVEILKDYTDEIIFYIEPLDMYIWGVTHWGTSWDYVLTDIKIDIKKAAC